ncbi:1,6-anhydro-N-acetylmuramyl-L-alanine amidase AmpD [Sansalvadorimonas verongulae]|uniref:1,6-anhydro-N-acetylmuramyl-L-alanine amidase AmpD n=1 Tax=Sansalvadorimonas verongulae TaxID=2172824 RepID=UPI0012BD472D|nr:1,6-anhydro-N-acetylmuramyl-L-alanine amidase AmpD [Sansalvadorimonas verongulae]MTI12888.1 1,6-anhydro-N-acetylmuramyl-L-alanine amidase AmpD [Sansalvadorimonas verongulae]
MNIVDGWLVGDDSHTVEHCPSPNCNERPENADVELLVIHNISLPPGSFGGPHIHELFTNTLDPNLHEYFSAIAHLEVSAHILIRRDGSVTQFVPFHQRAWHAGVSSWQGSQGCNDFSIGIELEGTDDMPYEAAQYQRLQDITKLLLKVYPKLTAENIAGHCDIAPGRKTDPGPAFQWKEYISGLS